MRISIIGFGMNGHAHITVEGLAAAKHADRILSLAADAKLLREFATALRIPAIQPLDHLYQNGAIDQENYDRIVQAVVDAAAGGEHVALLMYGHPRLGVSLTTQIERLATAQGGSVEVIIAPSSFDTMINLLRRDPLEHGSVLIDANRLLLFGLPLSPALDHYIYHVCSVGTQRVNFVDPRRGNHLTLLKTHLLEFFPSDHRVTLVGSDEGRTVQVEERLDQLEALLPAIRFGTSLFVPGIRPTRLNRAFVDAIRAERSAAPDEARVP